MTCPYVLQETGEIIHVLSGRCLDVREIPNSGNVALRSCNGDEMQKWTFQFYDLWFMLAIVFVLYLKTLFNIHVFVYKSVHVYSVYAEGYY